MKFRKLCFYDSSLIFCLNIINMDENFHKYAVRGGKRQRERGRERQRKRKEYKVIQPPIRIRILAQNNPLNLCVRVG